MHEKLCKQILTVAANKKFPFRFRGTAVQRFAVDKKR